MEFTPEPCARVTRRSPAGPRAGRTDCSRADALRAVCSGQSPKLDEHLSKVAHLAEAVSQAYGMTDDEIRWIRLAAELHDVGKLAIPYAILHKPGPLTREEWVLMRCHTVIGERIVRCAPSMVPAARLVRSSHERYDGAGYPDGLVADEIELGARIIAVCDAYDAMVTDRVYRNARSHEDALAELWRCAGAQFDPTVVERFCSMTIALDVGCR